MGFQKKLWRIELLIFWKILMRPKLKLCEMINDGNLTSAIGPICQNALGGGSTAFCRLNSISVFELFILSCFMNSNLDLDVYHWPLLLLPHRLLYSWRDGSVYKHLCSTVENSIRCQPNWNATYVSLLILLSQQNIFICTHSVFVLLLIWRVHVK